jgi:hypothetical protein
LIDLNDAKILSTQLDEAAGSVTIEVALAGSGKRKKATLLFEGVRSLPIVAESLKLAANPHAGNVLDWTPSPQSGNTFIYLLDGVISIWAQRLSVTEQT